MATLIAKVHALGTTNKDGDPCKGNLSVYGLNARFPITLYANQWKELNKVMPAIMAMIVDGEKAGTLAGESNRPANTSNGKVSLADYLKTARA